MEIPQQETTALPAIVGYEELGRFRSAMDKDAFARFVDRLHTIEELLPRVMPSGDGRILNSVSEIADSIIKIDQALKQWGAALWGAALSESNRSMLGIKKDDTMFGGLGYDLAHQLLKRDLRGFLLEQKIIVPTEWETISGALGPVFYLDPPAMDEPVRQAYSSAIDQARTLARNALGGSERVKQVEDAITEYAEAIRAVQLTDTEEFRKASLRCKEHGVNQNDMFINTVNNWIEHKRKGTSLGRRSADEVLEEAMQRAGL